MFSHNLSKKVNLSLFASIFTGYLLPTGAWILISLLNGLITFVDVKNSILHPMIIPVTLATMIGFIYFVKKVLNSVSTHIKNDELEKANKAYSLLQLSFLPPIMISGFIEVIFAMSILTNPIPHRTPIGLITSIVVVFLYALPFFMWFENCTIKIFDGTAVTRNTLAMGIKVRFIITILVPTFCVIIMFIASSVAFVLRSNINNIALSDNVSKLAFNLSILGIIAIFIIVIIFRTIVKMIQVPILEMVERFEEAREGSITPKPLSIYSRDEFGLLNDSFLSFFNHLHDVLSITNESLSELDNSNQILISHVDETAAAISEIHNSIENINEQIENQSSNVHQTSASVEEIARNIDSLNSSIEDQSANVIQSNQSVEQLISGIRYVFSLSKETDENVKVLGRASQMGNKNLLEISKNIQEIETNSKNLMEANNLISNIASQTNLLAMNAAIEAAHAGEAGRGFSVVADEIRKLAESASNQSKAIKSNLNIEINMVSDVVSSSEKTKESFSDILTSHKGVSGHVTNLFGAIKEQDQSSKEIQTALNEVNNITESVRLGAKEMTQVNGEILLAVKNLNDINSDVNKSITEINNGSSEIEKSTKKIVDLGNNNKINIKKLEEKLSFFKL